MSIKLNPVKSSNIKATGYDAASQTMRVQFGSGASHDYFGVTQADFDAMHKAESLGSHFAKNVRPKFKSAPVAEKAAA